ncbi:MAG: hypothetical protein ACKVP1_02180 [Burkholderiaceae bacterium]
MTDTPTDPTRQGHPPPAWMCIVWPAFLIAGLLEALVFAAVDPHELHWLGHALPLSRQGIYSLAFFMFWLLAMASSALTLLLAARPSEPSKPAAAQSTEGR